MPTELANRLDREAVERNMTFSALIVELIEQAEAPASIPYSGIFDDDQDLSRRVEEIMSRLVRYSVLRSGRDWPKLMSH